MSTNNTENSPKNREREILQKYLPTSLVDYTFELWMEHPVSFKISGHRQTKLGDFRYGSNQVPMITVNGTLNPYLFFITFVHELAHFIVWKKYGTKIRPHGQEWQNTYRQLIWPAIEQKCLPGDIEAALLNSLIRVKASSYSDLELMRVIKKYDTAPKVGVELLEIPNNHKFVFQDEVFVKLHERRTRIMCKHLASQKKYLVHKLALVNPVSE